MFSTNKKINSAKKGFTLVEALVAVSILMIAIASPMTLAQKGLSTATLSKDQMIAAFLVQDGVEAVKNIRDQIAKRGSMSGDWLDVLSPCICEDSNCNFNPTPVKYCTIDTTSSDWTDGDGIESSEESDPNPLKISYTPADLNGVRHFLKYDYSFDGTPSKFSRYINIRKTGELGGNEAVVSVRVSWNSPQGVQIIEAQDFIYNYSENI